MIVNQFNFNNGVSRGEDRARNYFPGTSLAPSDRTSIENVLKVWPYDPNERFVELFVELVTLASIVRSIYNEPPLKEDETVAYLGLSSWIFNSFIHR